MHALDFLNLIFFSDTYFTVEKNVRNGVQFLNYLKANLAFLYCNFD